MSTGRTERSISVLLIVVQTCGWYIKQILSRFWSCSLSRRHALLWSLHHIMSLALKSPRIVDLGSLISGVIISSSPSTLYILCSCSGLLLSHIRVDRVSVPSSKCICYASSDGIVCFIIVTIPCPPSSMMIRKIIQAAFVSSVLYHHDVKVILYDGCLDCRGLCNCSLCVPMYQLDGGSCSVCSVCCCGSSWSRRWVVLIRIVIQNKSIFFTHIWKRIWPLERFLKQLFLFCLSVLIASMADSNIFLSAGTRRAFPVEILLSRDVAMCIVSSTSSLCSSSVCCVSGLLTCWNWLADGPEREPFVQFADVATGNSFIDGTKGFVQALVVCCGADTTFTGSDFLFCTVFDIEFLAVGFGTYFHWLPDGCGLWSWWLFWKGSFFHFLYGQCGTCVFQWNGELDFC